MPAARCPRCDAPLPAYDLGGPCPRCLFSAGSSPDPPPGGDDEATTADLAAAGGRFEPPDPAALSERFPDLEVRRLIGRGGMGAVYEARQTRLDRPVALKILPPELGRDPAFAGRFLREAQALAQLNHRNVVTVFDSGAAGAGAVGASCGDLLYIVMELVDGPDLRAVMNAGIAPAEALSVVRQLCDGLEYAHARGVVHRDVKPENILLTAAGTVKIADFGLAKMARPNVDDDPAKAPTALTRTGQVMGTPQYMAPEQFSGRSGVDHRADIYALGVVFYELLTGKLPQGRYEPPSRYRAGGDDRLDEVILRALEFEPERRYQSAASVRTDVERALTPIRPDTERINIVPAPVADWGRRKRSRGAESVAARRATHSRIAVAVAALAAAAGALTIWIGDRPVVSEPPSSSPVPDVEQDEPLAVRSGEPLVVGPDGDFPTIAAALEYLKSDHHPFSPGDVLTVMLPEGILAERIDLDNSDFSLPSHIRIVGDPGGTTLAPSGAGPAITFKYAVNFTIERVTIDANDLAVAVKLSGVNSGVRLKDVSVRNVRGTGLVLAGLSRGMVIENLTVEAAGPDATGVRVEERGARGAAFSGGTLSGPFAVGVDLTSDVEDLLLDGLVIGPGTVGVRFAGAKMTNVALKKLVFRGVRRGVVFAGPPDRSSGGIVIANAAFEGVAEPIGIECEVAAVREAFDIDACIGNTTGPLGSDPLKPLRLKPLRSGDFDSHR